MQLVGYVTIRVLNDGKVVREDVIKNTVVNVGKAQTAGLIGGLVTTPFQYIAIGTDDGTTLALDATNTQLGAEVGRKQASVSQETTDVSNDTVVFQASFSLSDGFTGTSTIKESGIFDASTGGNMLCRAFVGPYTLNWDNGDALQITWKVQVK